MILFSEIIDAIIDLKLDPQSVKVFTSQGQIYPIVDYRLSNNQLHLINFNSNDYLDDVVTVQELSTFIEEEGILVTEATLQVDHFELVENKVLLF